MRGGIDRHHAALEDELIDTLIDGARSLPSPGSEIFVAQMGGATNRVPEDTTAYRGRNAQYIMNVHTRWEDPSEDETCVSWARSFFEKTASFAMDEAYVNFMPADEPDRVARAYGGNWERLQALKTKYDPDNRFRLNQNINPASVRTT